MRSWLRHAPSSSAELAVNKLMRFNRRLSSRYGAVETTLFSDAQQSVLRVERVTLPPALAHESHKKAGTKECPLIYSLGTP